MTFYLIHADAAATLASDDPVVPAAHVDALRSATDALAAAGRLRLGIDEQAHAAEAAARAEGLAAGRAEGLAAAAGEAHDRLLDLTRRAAAEQARLRGDVSRLALEVVRRIAEDIGEPALVAGLAERAAAELLPDAIATVRVPPAALDAVTARLARFPGLTVAADAGLAANECVFETPLGASHAGLDIQLAAVERAWAAALPEAGDAG